MLDRRATVALAKRMLALPRGAAPPSRRPTGYRVPAADYIDPVRWQLEMDRDLPARCRCRSRSRASCASPTRTRRWTRSASRSSSPAAPTASARAFVNSCRHRGADRRRPTGAARRAGSRARTTGGCTTRAGVPRRPVRRGVVRRRSTRSSMGLTPAGVRGAGGLRVRHASHRARGWTSTSGSATTPPSWRRSSSTRGTCTSERELPSPAWKVAFDGYLEGYHFSTLHKTTIFKDNMSNLMAVDAYGPHQRVMFAKHTLPTLRDVPEDEWVPTDHIGPVHTIFPCLSLAGAWRDTALVSLAASRARRRTARAPRRPSSPAHPVVDRRAAGARPSGDRLPLHRRPRRGLRHRLRHHAGADAPARNEGVRVRPQRAVAAPLPPLGGPARPVSSHVEQRPAGGNEGLPGGVDLDEVGRRELDVRGREVLVDVRRSAAAGDGHDGGVLVQQPGERQLPG